MDVRLYWDLLFRKEVLEQKPIVVQKKIKLQEQKPILIQKEKEPILYFDQTRDEENLVLEERFLKAPDWESAWSTTKMGRNVACLSLVVNLPCA